MWFRKKKKEPAYKEGELSIIGTVLSIISEHIGDRIEIYGYTDYFATLLQNSNIDFETQEFSFSWMKRVLIIEPRGNQTITIDYWKAEDFRITQAVEKARKTIFKARKTVFEVNTEYEIKEEIDRIENGKYMPRVVVDGHLTKDQYVGALYARLDAVRHMSGLARELR